MSHSLLITPFVVPEDAVTDRETEAVVVGALVAEAEVDAIEVTGPGVVSCLQGVFTNDIEQPGNGAFVYGATLTAKGMIVCDMWIARDDGRAWLTVPASGRDALLDHFTRYLPPRLARPTVRSEDVTVLRVAGPRAHEIAVRAGVAVPPPGTCATAVVREAACLVSRPADNADFALQVQVDRSHAAGVLAGFTDAGAVQGSASALEVARILNGWPRLGAEIDEKTLPQEVRYDEIDGVSYTKGCYTGQETVARVHFRGHTNRQLVGLIWDGEPDPTQPSIRQDDRAVGRISSLAYLQPFRQYIGLGLVRREIDHDLPTAAGDAPVEITRLPFQFES